MDHQVTTIRNHFRVNQVITHNIIPLLSFSILQATYRFTLVNSISNDQFPFSCIVQCQPHSLLSVKYKQSQLDVASCYKFRNILVGSQKFHNKMILEVKMVSTLMMILWRIRILENWWKILWAEFDTGTLINKQLRR